MRHAAIGFAFGFVVMVCGMASAGAGHGSSLPLALGAAPLSLLPPAGFFAAPVLWATIGFLADRRWPLAVFGLLVVGGLLLVTIAALPLANEDEKSAASHGGSPRHGAIRPQVRAGVNPMAALGLG